MRLVSDQVKAGFVAFPGHACIPASGGDKRQQQQGAAEEEGARGLRRER